MNLATSADQYGHSRVSGAWTLDANGTWPDDCAREWTLDLLAIAEREIAITAVVLTGSAARCVADVDDLDLVIVYEQHRPVLSRAPISVDLRPYEQSEVLHGLSWGPRLPIVDRAVRSSVVRSPSVVGEHLQGLETSTHVAIGL